MLAKWSILLSVLVLTHSSGLSQVIKSLKDDSLNIPNANMKPQDSTSLPILKLTGFTSRLEFGYLSNPLPNQESPNYFSRFYFEPEFSLNGIKFSTSIMSSTEDLVQGKNLNYFNLGIDRNSIIDKLVSLAKKSENLKALDSLENSFRFYENLTEQISNKGQSSRFLNDIENARKNLERAKSDSIYALKHKSEVLRAKILLEERQKELRVLDSINVIKKSILLKHQLLKNIIEKGVATNKIDASRLNTTSLNNSKITDERNKLQKQHQKELNLYQKLSYIKNFQLLDAYPTYSLLAFNGFLVRGIDFEWNNNRQYFSTTAGLINNQSESKTKLNLNGKHFSGRFGFGNLDENYTGLFFSRTEMPFSNTFNSEQNLNYLTGIQIGAAKEDKRKVYIERIYSILTNPRYLGQNHLESLFKSIFNNFQNSASVIRYSENFWENKTNLETEFLRVDPFFFAFGNQYLRSDTRRIGISANQYLFRNRLKILAAFNNTRDNLTNYKSNTTQIEELSLGYELKLRKNHLKMRYRDIGTKFGYEENTRKTQITMASISNNQKFRGINNNFIFTINHLNSFGYKTESYKNLMFNVFNLSSFRRGTTVDIGFTFTNEFGGAKETLDSSNTSNWKIGFGFPIYKNCFVKTSYNYWNNRKQQIGQIIQASTNINLKKGLSLTFSYSFQSIENKILGTNQPFHSGRIGLVYKFISTSKKIKKEK
jgi:hypothetical protein